MELEGLRAEQQETEAVFLEGAAKYDTEDDEVRFFVSVVNGFLWYQLRLHGQEDAAESAEAEQGEEQEAEAAAAAEAEGAQAEAVRRVVARKGRPFGGGKLDLKFNKGDVLVVERQDDDIWLYGFVEAKPEAKGRFPSNLVYR